MRLRRLCAVLVGVGTAAALSAVVPFAAEAAPAPRKPGAGVATSVTLITGDRVTFTGRTVSVQRAPGREKVRFLSRTTGGHRYVIPVDALNLLKTGKVDQRLFDLTALQDFGYTGDAALPLLVSYPKNSKRRPALVTGRVTRDLTGVRVLAVAVPQRGRAGLWASMAKDSGVERVYLDGKRKVNLDVSVPQIGAPTAWAEGLDGTGVTVAVLDTGIDATHPDFAGKIVARENFTTEPSTDDVVGHGTHVASIIAGSGAGAGGKYKGVAPGAKLAIGKVCVADGCEESAILAGMQWAARTAPVVNMSLGGGDAPSIDPLEQAVNDLTAAHGSLFVIAAGNSGSGHHTVESPGSAEAALTVGAVDGEDQIAEFSSRGPRSGDDAIKPDITAPGVDIVAAGAANGVIGTPATDGYVSLSGTSMATPHVAGAAAIVTQQHPGWSARQRKTLLMGAAKPTEGASVFEQGAGRVDVARSVHQAVSVDEGSVSFGIQRWPHDDDTPMTKSITYRNGGPADITLSLALRSDSDKFTLSATGVIVPAGGTAQVEVTADTRGDGPDGYLTGRVVATGGDVRVETPVAVNREVESYDVAIQHIGRDGQPSSKYQTALFPLSNGRLKAGGEGRGLFGDPPAQARLPKGEYGLYSWIIADDNSDITMLAAPKLVIDGPETITLDARRGQPVAITPPSREAGQAMVVVNANWPGSQASALSLTPGDMFIAPVGERSGSFTSSINSAFAKPDADGGFSDSPYTYEASYLRKGSFYSGFVKAIDPATLAQVKSSYNQEAGGDAVIGYKTNAPEMGGIGAWSAGLPFRLPFQRTEWLNTDGPTAWAASFEQFSVPDSATPSEFLSESEMLPTKLEAGQVYKQDWNRAPFAPSVAGDIDVANRTDDTITAQVPLFSEAGGKLGWSVPDQARTALYSGNELIGQTSTESGQFAVPPGARPYRLEMSASRGAPHRLSTSVSGTWTFTSGHGDYRLPLSTVRLHPKLDKLNRAPAGAFTVPVTVQRSKGSAAKRNRQLTAEFSTDDGRSWQPARVTGNGDEHVIKVANPATPSAVSLRVHTIDSAGNTATITVIRAYVIG
ncbi:S8 family serine peptidase [Actinoplanes sp. NPDC049265]|uniref:S8 family serine peptidase n=1 Tax=Actinoplanes sp. NPDC049265 TaxID=3363902 RepID=UPI00371EBFC4